MNFRESERHHKPHIHAVYNGKKASFAIRGGQVLGGKLPPRQTRMVRDYIKKHQNELLEEWNKTQAKMHPRKVAP